MRKLLYYGVGFVIAAYSVLLGSMLLMYAPMFFFDEWARGLLLLTCLALPLWTWLLTGDRAREYVKGATSRGAKWLLLPPAVLVLSVAALGLTP